MRQEDLFEDLRPNAGRRLMPLDPSVCPHPEWDPSETIWPGEHFKRLTATCACCGIIRGRWPAEFTRGHRSRTALNR